MIPFITSKKEVRHKSLVLNNYPIPLTYNQVAEEFRKELNLGTETRQIFHKHTSNKVSHYIKIHVALSCKMEKKEKKELLRLIKYHVLYQEAHDIARRFKNKGSKGSFENEKINIVISDNNKQKIKNKNKNQTAKTVVAGNGNPDSDPPILGKKEKYSNAETAYRKMKKIKKVLAILTGRLLRWMEKRFTAQFDKVISALVNTDFFTLRSSP